MAPKVYLITGANRGIGLSLVNEIATKKAEVSIFAGVRNPSTATSLEELSKKCPGKITIVKYISADEEGNRALAKEIETKHGHLDVVIACAGIATYMGSALDTPAGELRDHLDVNVTGILVLFQSVHSLLKASTSSPRFIPISSAAASLTAFISLPAGYTCYGASKVAVNYIARKIHFENDWIICFPLAPGIVQTDMSRANREMDKTGTLAPIQDAMAMSTEQAAPLLVGVVENATREKDSGEFMNIDGQKLSW
ncbi:NAD(P)-binding protein [Armillaria luteobubalina]|uniref:NAD(P)-binding protein n=1 Tax=Armillaria luteobubalina TaxID=153913 RepID=A0AA39UZC5_9AGAR|nr:NAD(P)-binding protein [Armillaria luteobubalina]